MTIYSTSNLPKLLNSARDDGWTVLGAAADVPDGAAIRGGRRTNEDDYDDVDNDVEEGNEWDLGESVAVEDIYDDENAGSNRPKPRCFDLNDVKTGKPTIIVLGSEGELHSIRASAIVGTSPLYYLFIRLHYIPHVGCPSLRRHRPLSHLLDQFLPFLHRFS